jgi:NADPH:quinone reductase
MKSLFFDTPGNPAQVLKVGDLAIPKPKGAEALVRVLASSINPADFFFIEGTYSITPRLPQVAGMDAVGRIVESVGPFKKNDLVAFRHPGSWAEFNVVPVEKLIVVPEDLAVEKAAQLYLNAGTAWGLLDRANLKEKEWLLLTAGNSTVAKIITQLATSRGINVISAVRDMRQAQGLKNIGAKAVIDISSEKDLLGGKIEQLTGGKGLSAVFDAVGGPESSGLIKLMGLGGTFIVYGLLSSELVSYHNSSIIYKQLKIEAFRIAQYVDQLHDKSSVFKKIIQAISPSSFRMEIEGKFSLDDFHAAINASRGGKALFWMNE